MSTDDKLDKLLESAVRSEAQIGGVRCELSHVHKKIDRLQDESDEQRTRITEIEKRQAWYAGGAAAGGGLLAWLANILFH